jgi:regulator of protease activity HflC (stomatin/prohibitin superfamily)
MNQPSREVAFPNPLSGVGMLLVGIGLIITVFGIPLGILVLFGLTLVNPNQSKVVVLFGDYKGTLRQHGFYWLNPFSVRKTVSLRAHNFNSDKLKVNDLRGNPIEIGAVVVWRVRDTAQAAFDVEDFESYVEVQTESALRHLASKHPYDTPHDNESSLRGSGDEIHAELQRELDQRLQMAGIEALEVRLSHLAYAPEIAGAMLQRQQAEAVLDARARIVEGAVSMVKMALDRLQQDGVVELDKERKAQMVSSLLVVLCSDRGAQPVMNAGPPHG